MKNSPWFLGGVVLAVLSGIVFLLVAFFQPGQATLPEISGGTDKSFLAENKKRLADMRGELEKLRQEEEKPSRFKGTEGEHRIFVSTQLVYLPGNSEPVQPLDRQMKTEDGLEVGWKIKYGFDPTDPEVCEEDPDRDGFTNLEEFTLEQIHCGKRIVLRRKVSCGPGWVWRAPWLSVFQKKGAGSYSIRFQIGSRRKEFKGKPGDHFWLMAGPDVLEIFAEEGKSKAAAGKAKEAGACEHIISLKLVDYLEKIEKVKDATTGGLELDVDNSELTLERSDALKGITKLFFSTPQRPRSTSWETGDIRFVSPILSGNGIGPFRLGQTFSFEGKQFAVISREGGKVQLRDLSETREKMFWVPSDTTPRKHPPIHESQYLFLLIRKFFTWCPRAG